MAGHGFVNLCKPRGWTSHDAVAKARHLLGTRAIGHAGTLDPLAEGVLPLAVNRATRLVERVADGAKAYYAELRLGEVTDTLDADGQVVERREVPALTPTFIQTLLDGMAGPQLQTPPAYSAIKVQGRRAYDLARRGAPIELPPRQIEIFDLQLCWLRGSTLAIELRCSKGTYVRALARDVGEVLGCGAHVTRLVRTAVAGFQLDDAVSLEELGRAERAGRADDLLIAPDEALRHLGAMVIQEHERRAMRHGQPWSSASSETSGDVRTYTADGAFLGLAACEAAGSWRPRWAVEAA